MTDAQVFDELQYSVLGENAPRWLIAVLTVLGIMMAAAATWLSLTPQLSQPALPPAVGPAAVQGNTLPQAVPANSGTNQSAKPASVATTAAVESVAAHDTMPACPEEQTVHFRFGKSIPITRVKSADFVELIDWARQYPGAKLVVEGHSDVVGADESNVLLSYSRAKLVAGVLQESGISSQQVQLAAAGSHAPIEGIPADADANRRVIVRMNDPEHCLNRTN
jgi:outer membrane protein OmpA-like peptidoglycan-associated protein